MSGLSSPTSRLQPAQDLLSPNPTHRGTNASPGITAVLEPETSRPAPYQEAGTILGLHGLPSPASRLTLVLRYLQDPKIAAPYVVPSTRANFSSTIPGPKTSYLVTWPCPPVGWHQNQDSPGHADSHDRTWPCPMSGL